MSDANENPDGYDPLGGSDGEDKTTPSSPIDGSNPAIGPDAGGQDRTEGAVHEGPDGDVPPRGFPEQ